MAQIIANGTVTTPQGFRAGAVYAGIKTWAEDKLDVGLLCSSAPCIAAGVFTTNKVIAAPVVLTRERVQQAQARALVVNSGNANACTGEQGLRDAEEMAALAAKVLGVQPKEVLVASTGIIGVTLPMEKMRAGISRVSLDQAGGHALARAIMTTDTFAKEIAVALALGDRQASVGGISKGAGMIHPNMATMLCFLTTDLAVEPGLLQRCLLEAVDVSFNMITVDGDTSTNDMVVVLANGLAGNEPLGPDSPQAQDFQQALTQVCVHLAKAIVRDGEGATRLIQVTIEGALSQADARAAARSVAGSSLVKTAVHGGDPNWGRIVAALGRSGAHVVESKLDVWLDTIPLMQGGRPVPFDGVAARYRMQGPEVPIRLHLNLGEAAATAWGCDLSEAYVTFNSAYTT